MNDNPNQSEQDKFAKEEMQSARAGFGILLIILFTVLRTVHIFSRVPGTSGPILIVAHMLGMVAQFWYYEANVEVSGQHDLIVITWLIALQCFWFTYGLFRTFYYRLRGMEFEVNDLGVGILYRRMNGSSAAAIGFASDMLIACSLATMLFLASSPIGGSWYMAMVVCLFFTHVWMQGMERMQLQRFRNAQSRAEDFTRQLNRYRR